LHRINAYIQFIVHQEIVLLVHRRITQEQQSLALDNVDGSFLVDDGELKALVVCVASRRPYLIAGAVEVQA